jgi:co-chaperonin GroES (HSP10)
MSVRMLGKLIGVERLNKADSQASSSPWVMPEVSDNLGVVKFIGSGVDEKQFPSSMVGKKVYFGSTATHIKMQGMEILVMGLDNVFAISEEN